MGTVLALCRGAAGVVLFCSALGAAPAAHADNTRFNNGVVENVYTVHKQAGCPTGMAVNPKLRLAAQWHTEDVLSNYALDGDLGSDGTSVADRARNAGYVGVVAETVAIDPALAMSGLELINQWYYRPDYKAIMADCANIDIGVWSESRLDRTVAVAVYGQGDSAPPAHG